MFQLVISNKWLIRVLRYLWQVSSWSDDTPCYQTSQCRMFWPNYTRLFHTHFRHTCAYFKIESEHAQWREWQSFILLASIFLIFQRLIRIFLGTRSSSFCSSLFCLKVLVVLSPKGHVQFYCSILLGGGRRDTFIFYQGYFPWGHLQLGRSSF